MARGRSRSTHAAGYWERTHWPLQSLYFLLPLLVFYELGTLWYATDRALGVTSFIRARSLLDAFFHLFGVTGYYLPGVVVVVVLVCLHLVKPGPWKPQPRLLGLMWIEAAVLAVPLFVFGLVFTRSPAAAGMPLNPGWQAQVIFSIGAGIYEELLFRLIAIALLHLVLVDVLALPARYGAVGAIGLSAVAFALYHFSESNPFQLTKFIFYTIAGVYFAGVYVLRGFGIVAGTHALYDVLVIATHYLHTK